MKCIEAISKRIFIVRGIFFVVLRPEVCGLTAEPSGCVSLPYDAFTFDPDPAANGERGDDVLLCVLLRV
jgi:hypothetical protein